MSRTLFKTCLRSNEIFSQKCLLPVFDFQVTSIKMGDFVAINCGCTEYICRVFIRTQLEECAVIDDTVSCNTNCGPVETEVLNFPEDFTAVKISNFERLEIKLLYRDGTDNLHFPHLKHHCHIASKILQNFVVRKNAVIKCADHKVADLFNIHSIIVCETFCAADVYGRTSRTTTVEIVGIVSLEQSKLLKEYKNFEIGGAGDAMEQLRISTKVCQRILVLGPQGCGKSTLIKKFCCDVDGLVLMVDGNLALNHDVLNSYCTQFINSSQMFPNFHNVLFIDNIDKLASCDSKLKAKSDFLIYLIKRLEWYNVLIITATTHKSLINPSILSLFQTEVCLGPLSFEQRKEALKVLLKQCDLGEVDYDDFAHKTPGFLACDMGMLVGTVSEIKSRSTLENENSKTLTTADFDKVLETFTPSLLRTSIWRLKVKPIYWKDIGGMRSIKEKLQLAIEKPLLHPDIFKKVDLPTPRGVLLFGPPGCCKTTIARGLATECKANFFAASPSQIYSPYVGESEKNISELFYEARLCTPSIVFMDELDSLVGRREFDTKTVGVSEKVLSTLLTEMDGFGVEKNENPQQILSYCGNADEEDNNERMNEQVVVIAATNRPDLIDDALLRPGRFDMILYIPPPDAEERESILRTFTEGLPLQNVDLAKIANKTERFSGADLKHLYKTAVMIALKENKDVEFITEQHFMEALENIRCSITHEQIQMYERLASKYGTFISE